MFKYVDYSNIKKSGGSREPLRFQSIDPLFYLSSLLLPYRKEPAACWSAGSLFAPKERLPFTAAFCISGNEIFKDGKPAFPDCGIILFFGAECPGNTLNTIEFPADPCA